MISKIIFVLATVCIINTSVLTVNVVDDEVSDVSVPVSELSEDQTERGCNMRACDQLCRRLKFPGGACVNGRCKCDKFLNAGDGVSEKSLSNAEDPVSQQDASPLSDVTSDENEESVIGPNEIPSLRTCVVVKCNQKCRRLKYIGGHCRQGQCRCF